MFLNICTSVKPPDAKLPLCVSGKRPHVEVKVELLKTLMNVEIEIEYG